MNGPESERLRRATERLIDGHREALEVTRRSLDSEALDSEALDGGALDGGAPAEDALVDLEDILQDILQGALDDARAILGTEEGDGA